MMETRSAQRLVDASTALQHTLLHGDLPPPQFAVSELKYETAQVVMRDGIRLATDLYLPPITPAPVIVIRTPYGRNLDGGGFVGSLVAFARRGYAVVAQDCRGTGASEPGSWDYYVYEQEDGYDLIEWIREQNWCNGFIGACGGSYAGQTQWCMAMHSGMSTIVPLVSGLGVATNTAHLYMFLNAYAHAIGKGTDKVSVHISQMERLFEKETLEGGYFNEPLHRPLSTTLVARFPELRALPATKGKKWLWQHYCQLTCAQRAEFLKEVLGVENITSTDIESLSEVFGQQISHDALTVPYASKTELGRAIHAPPLIHTGWYDWALNDALATWGVIRRDARAEVASRARLLITPYAHNMPGYHEGLDTHPELLRVPSMVNHTALLLSWYETVRNGSTDSWPTVIYYLMGANEWQAADEWPPKEVVCCNLYLSDAGRLTTELPQAGSAPDGYRYDPKEPTPTVGGSIVSYVYPPGSVDVRSVQDRPDVIDYTTPPLSEDLDVIGSLRMILYASSSALDTDFVARLSDVFPDGRAIQLQSGVLRARYRGPSGEPELLEPGHIYRLEIDMWATANRFKAGHRLRVDISSADFPHFDRNSNRGGTCGEPVVAQQLIFHDDQYPSHLILPVLGSGCRFGR